MTTHRPGRAKPAAPATVVRCPRCRAAIPLQRILRTALAVFFRCDGCGHLGSLPADH